MNERVGSWRGNPDPTSGDACLLIAQHHPILCIRAVEEPYAKARAKSRGDDRVYPIGHSETSVLRP